MLIAARALQGVGGALLTPGSLAIISGVVRAARTGPGRSAPGPVSAASPARSGRSSAAGWSRPWSWRLVFLINLPLAAMVVWSPCGTCRSRATRPRRKQLDLPGTLLGALGLAGLTYALDRRPASAAPTPVVVAPAWSACSALVGIRGGRAAQPPPDGAAGLFGSRQFTVANIVTFLVYGALGAVLFLLVAGPAGGGRLSPAGGRHLAAADHAAHAGAVVPVRRAGARGSARGCR